MDYKWESDEKNLFYYHFKVGDYVSIRGGKGDLKLAKVEQVKDARLWVKLVKFGDTTHHNRHRGYRWGYRMSESSTFLVTAQDFVKKGYPLYKKKVEEIKENNKNYHQDCVNYNARRGNPQKIKKPSYTKLIQKKLNEPEAPAEYQSIYNYFTPNIRSGRAVDYKPHNDDWSNSRRKEESESEEEEDEQYEIKILTEEEYQQIVEKMSYNKFLNQFIKQEQIDRELKIEKSTNNSSNKNSKIKTFEINDKRVKRFAMKYIKPEDLEQRLNQKINNNDNNNNNNNNNSKQQQEEVEQNQFEYNNNNKIDNDNYYYYNDNNQDGFYNNQVYQEEVYYIEPEEVVTFDDYNLDNVGSGGGVSDGKVEKNKIIFKQNEVFKKLEKELHVSTNHYYNEDYERLINTFNSGFILQDELHQRRMDLLRDHFNIDLSKFQI
ncbi:hypothetical protein ACTFIY_003419 [Dictyostelium cf. discoideum]